MSKLIFIYSIPRTTATGISEWVSESSGIKLKKTKVGRATDRISALYSTKVGGLANYISYNYYTDPLTGEVQHDAQGNKILLQEYLEKKWNKPPGFFSNQAASRNYRGDGSDLGYYYQTFWELRDGATVLDLSKMDDEIGYYVMLASSKVANSEREWREHKWPKATHYIALENESEEIKYARTQLKSRAFAILHSPEVGLSYKQKMLAILNITTTKVPYTEMQVHNMLSEYIESSTYTPNSNIEKLINLTNLLKTKDGREKFEAMFILKQAMDRRIVHEKKDTYTYFRTNGNTVVIGERYSEAIDFITNPKKITDVEEMLEQIKQKSN
jgi:hypothetical protein